MIFTKNSGRLDDIKNCNESFKNKCVIASPKITYGVNISDIHYKHIYAVYSSQTIDSMTMIQQIGRARDCEKVSVLFVKNHKTKNHYISFEANKKLEEESLNTFKTRIENRHKAISELCLNHSHKGLSFNLDSVFTNIHFYISWFDKLFSSNKLELFKLICSEQGFNVKTEELKLNKEDGKGLTKLSEVKKFFDEKYVDLAKEVFDGNRDSPDYEKYGESVEEYLKSALEFFNITDTKEPYARKFKDLICDPVKLEKYIRSLPLFKPKEEIKKNELFYLKKEIPLIAKDNNIYDKMINLYWLEDLLEIERFEVDKIDCDVDEIREKLLENIDKVSTLIKRNKINNKKHIKNVINKINKLEKKFNVQRPYNRHI